MPKRRWIYAIASIVIVLAIVGAFAWGQATAPHVLQTCGGAIMPNGRCGPLPIPGDPGTTCVPDPQGCDWEWESPYPVP